ncbi:MAG: hypothetical protein KIC94_12300 [Clostridiales bacterium]|nr:hypothetical protein [Clostridiales bacterium]
MYSHDSLCNEINIKGSFKHLNANMQSMISKILGGIVVGDPILRCAVIPDTRIKPNLKLSINSKDYYISVLNGQGNSVHEESPYDINAVLTALKASSNVIKCINDLCYYRSHTTDFVNNLMITNPLMLTETRDFLMNYRHFFIERAIKTGMYGLQPSEFIYWGDVNYGVIKEVNQVVINLESGRASKSLFPIGKLALQRKDYTVNNNIQIKWSHPERDLS